MPVCVYHDVRVREPLRNCANEHGDRRGMCIFESLCLCERVWDRHRNRRQPIPVPMPVLASAAGTSDRSAAHWVGLREPSSLVSRCQRAHLSARVAVGVTSRLYKPGTRGRDRDARTPGGADMYDYNKCVTRKIGR